MSEHIWKPVEAVDEGMGVQTTYRNERGEEYE